MNSAPSISQLQLRVFIIVIAIFVLTKATYRVFIERPQIEETLSLLIKSDLDDIRHDAQRYLTRLEDTNYKFSRSKHALEFLQSANQDYIDEQVHDELFAELEIDGIFFIDDKLQTVFKKGLNHLNKQEIAFELDDFDRFPLHRQLFQPQSDKQKYLPISGMIATVQGPAFFSSAQVSGRQDDENHGYIMIVRLLEQVFLDEISQDSYAELSLDAIDSNADLTQLKRWTDIPVIGRQHPVNQLVIEDYFNRAIAVLTVTHTTSIVSPWLDERGFIYISVLVVLLLAWRIWAIKRFVTPIRALSLQIKAMSENLKLEKLNEDNKIAELNQFAESFNQLTTTVKQQAGKLNEQIYLDPLTQIANRRAFNQHFTRQINLLKRHNIGFCLIMADVDYFKRYNDSLGHLAGDEALVSVAKILTGFFKRNADICARYGGEEFITLFSDVSIGFAEQQMRDILATMHEQAIEHPDSPTASCITLSLGACFVDGNKVDAGQLTQEEVIALADKALYRSKEQGRNCSTTIQYSL